MNKAVLACCNLHKRFTQGDLSVDVLQNVDLSIGYGQRIAIMGASGSGKSTLLHLLGGLDVPTKGQVFLDGIELGQLNERKLAEMRNRVLGFVYQFHHLLGEFTVLENVAMPLLIGNVSVQEATALATAILKRVGLTKRFEHKPGELSGGEREQIGRAHV